METFTPIAMKCTQEQFYAMRPKLDGYKIHLITDFTYCNYLVNKLGDVEKTISNVSSNEKLDYNRTVHEEWNEEIFLKACGIEGESLEQQLQKAEAEVKRLKEAIEDSQIKDKDWVYCSFNESIFKYTHGTTTNDLKKITDKELINKLNELIK